MGVQGISYAEPGYYGAREIVMKTGLLIWMTMSALRIFGCECSPVSLDEDKKLAEIVFRGTITNVSGGKVSFRVNRIWKGDSGSIFEMPEFTQGGGACMGFRPNLLRVGNDVIVFAARLHRFPGDNDYFTNACTRTNLSSQAGDTLAKLGKGKPPRGGTELPRRNFL